MRKLLPLAQGITKWADSWYVTTTNWRVTKGTPLKLWREGYLFKITNGKLAGFTRVTFNEYDHVGDLCIYKGYLYLPLEDYIYTKPLVAIYNLDLHLIKTMPIPGIRHFPWCAVRDDILFTSEFLNVNEIIKFDLNKREVRRVPLNVTLSRVQGGCWLRDKLLLSCDDKLKMIYQVDLQNENGIVRPLIATKIPGEMEGIYAEDNTIFCVDHDGNFWEWKLSDIT